MPDVWHGGCLISVVNMPSRAATKVQLSRLTRIRIRFPPTDWERPQYGHSPAPLNWLFPNGRRLSEPAGPSLWMTRTTAPARTAVIRARTGASLRTVRPKRTNPPPHLRQHHSQRVPLRYQNQTDRQAQSRCSDAPSHVYPVRRGRRIAPSSRPRPGFEVAGGDSYEQS